MNKYARVGIYTLSGSATMQEVVDAINQSALPMYKQQPGFVSYTVVSSGNTIISTSVWETSEAAQKASEMMSNWAKETLPTQVSQENDFNGEVVVSA